MWRSFAQWLCKRFLKFSKNSSEETIGHLNLDKLNALYKGW